jgi:ABC-2 type transport system ATP-binding protein
MVSASEISKTYSGVQVVKNCSFSLPEGSVTALAGPNGAGKTTLLKIVAQALKPDTGTVSIGGGDARKFLPFIGYVPQQNAFFYELTVRENLNYWFNGTDQKAYGETVERLELSPLLAKKASALSGGMQRRLNMAVTLVNSPRLLIMDEPLTGVDVATRMLFMQWMRDLKRHGLTIFYSTHHSDEIAGTADSLFLMRGGALSIVPDIRDGQNTERLIFEFIRKKSS